MPDAWTLPDAPDQEATPLRGTLLSSVQSFQNQRCMRISKASLVQGFRDVTDR